MSEQELIKTERETAQTAKLLKYTLAGAVFILGVCIVELVKTFI
jgi:hypothetical protein